MFASKKTIKRAQAEGYGVPKDPSNELRKALELGYDIHPAYVVSKPSVKKLTKLQKKHKSRKSSRNARMYNLLHA